MFNVSRRLLLKIISLLFFLFSTMIIVTVLLFNTKHSVIVKAENLAPGKDCIVEKQSGKNIKGRLSQKVDVSLPQGFYEIEIDYRCDDIVKKRPGYLFIFRGNKTLWEKGIHAHYKGKLRKFILITRATTLIELSILYRNTHLHIDKFVIKPSIYQRFLWGLALIFFLASVITFLDYKPRQFQFLWLCTTIAFAIWLPKLIIFTKNIAFVWSWQGFLYVFVAILAGYHFIQEKPSATECGLTDNNFFVTVRYLLLPSLFAIFILVALGFWRQSLQLTSPKFIARMFPSANISVWLTVASLIFCALVLPKYNSQKVWIAASFTIFFPLSGFLQQLAIQCYIHREIAKYLKPRIAIIFVVIYFVVMHTPNLFVMIGTMYLMYFWAKCYQKYNNIYAIVLSHHVVSMVMKYALPTDIGHRAIGHNFMEQIGWIWKNYPLF